MATITLSVPNEIKEKMEEQDWINWSSVARKAFLQTIDDVELLKKIQKVRKISEINEKDNRILKESFVKQAITAIEKAKNGKKMSAEEFDKWCKKI